MFKDIALSLFFVMATLDFGLAGASAQTPLAPDSSQPAQGMEPGQAAQPAVSADDPRLLLMIRNAIIALNQANLTGNYSVLRDMGTSNFQMTNSSARLAEVFATLRNRRIDISPIMFFNPKLSAPPGIQDGQVLRVAGVFPTTPEQVNFDLAFQLTGEQWMLAAIAVNVAPPGENMQASAPTPQPSRTAESGEKPIRIDLSQPSAPGSAQPAPPKKAAGKKPKPPAQQTAAAARPGAPAPDQPPAPPPVHRERPAPSGPDSPAWNPFGR